MPCLLCVDETGIKPNPVCFESRLSAPLNMPTSETGTQAGGRQLKGAGQGPDPDTVAMLTSDDIW